MTQSFNPRSKLSEVDTAFEIMQTHGKSMYYLNLIEEVIERQGLKQDPARISSILTQINLDTRFAYIGQGEWSLKAWVPTRSSRRLPNITLMNKSLAYDDEKEKDAYEGDSEEDFDDLEHETEEDIDGDDSLDEDDSEEENEKWK